MITRKLLLILLVLVAVNASAQTNFSFSPEKPKPGDIITITYEPAGDIANTIKPVEAAVYQSTSKGNKADDLVLTKIAKKYSATIQTDTGANFIYIGF